MICYLTLIKYCILESKRKTKIHSQINKTSGYSEILLRKTWIFEYLKGTNFGRKSVTVKISSLNSFSTVGNVNFKFFSKWRSVNFKCNFLGFGWCKLGHVWVRWKALFKGYLFSVPLLWFRSSKNYRQPKVSSKNERNLAGQYWKS